jgi:class 3 adenylate cyclase/tetratricopeptide (TPR) repeat protein
MHCAACGTENPAAARFCSNCGARLVARVSPEERRQVTVLFADFAGFTSYAHSRDAEDVRDYISSVWAQLDDIIAAHGGITEKHIGDAIMALFGARQAREEDPIQAVRAALAMQACLAKFKSAEGQPALKMRIGIHTGVVVIGPLGAAGEITATGDAVNLTSRLEEQAPTGGILMSHDTYRQLYGLFDVQVLAPLNVQGRPEPIQTYLVLRAKPRGLAAQLRGVEGVQTEMIGRERELDHLQSALQQAMTTREAQIVTIVGEAGIGKSCLLREFQKRVELLPQTVRFFYGRATPEMATLPFSLMRGAFCARFEIPDSDPPALAREKFERGLLELIAASGRTGAAGEAEDPRLQAHFIGQLLGLDFSSSPWLRDILNDREQIRHRAFHCLSHFFDVVTQGHVGNAPVSAAILVAEDIHWGDEGSLDLLAHLARACRRVPLLLIFLARPILFERRPAWGEGLAGHTRLDLEPLSRSQSLALVDAILHRAPQIPPALHELIVRGAEGNPFYIEELIKMLIDQHVIVPGADQWRVEPVGLAAARVPATLTGILQARLDGLLAAERLVLQRASVVGRVFWDNAVERLTDPNAVLAAAAMREALEGLRRKELIFRRHASAFADTTEYVFKHELLRNVAYEGLLRKLRRQYHAEVALWLIEQSGERVNEFAGLVATHFEHAGRSAEAAAWHGRAGEQARSAYAPATAIEHFRKAISLLPPASSPADGRADRSKLLEWHEGLSEVLGAQARFAEALEACGEMRKLAETEGDPVAQARAWNGLAFLNERLGKNRSSIECAERAEVLARESGATGTAERIRALLLKGWALYRLSDASAVLAIGDQTRRFCLESGNRAGLATSLKLLGVARLQLGDYREADRFFEQGLALYQESGDRRNTAAMWSNLGESARMRGDYHAAEVLYGKALAAVREIGHRESEAIYLTNLSAARLGLKQFRQVEADLREAIALTDGANFCALSASYSFLSEACLGQGKPAEAFDAARRALALAKESENDLDLGTAWRALGQSVTALNPADSRPAAATARPKPLPRAGACFAKSLSVFEKINAEGEQAATLRAWAEFELKRGRIKVGRQKGEAARAIYQRLAAAPELARTETWLQEAFGQTYPG